MPLDIMWFIHLPILMDTLAEWKKGLNFEGVIAYRPYGVIEIQALNGEPSYILAVSLIDSYRLKGHWVSLLITPYYEYI